jgi:hypothetical protein
MHNDYNEMNKSELHKIIQEAIDEVLAEADLSPAEQDAKRKELAAIDAKIKALNIQKGDLASGREEVAEGELDELANVAIRYELAPDAAAADFAGKKARIVSAMQATEEPMSKMDVAGALGYDKQNPINADFMALVADGVIVPSGAQAAPRFSRPAAEPAAGAEVSGEEGPEGGIEGEMSDEEVDAMFAKVMRGDEEEPEAGEIEKGGVTASSMSDEDYEAFMQYTDLEGRLAKVKSDILKNKRSRGVAGDIADQPSSDVENLRNLKDRLQKKMDDLLASSEYLRKRQAKLTGKPVEEPKVDNEEEEQLDEWVKGRMQYYAGIKK